MSLLKSIFTFIMLTAIAGFCILNAQTVNVAWSPIHENIELPLYAIILGSILTGFIIGATALWINSGTMRKEKRKAKKHIKSLEKELSQTSANTNNQKPPSDFFPALPNKSNS